MRLCSTILATVFVLGACGGQAPTPADVDMVATTSVVADLVSNAAGADAAVITLMPVGADPHDYRPSPGEVAEIYDSDFVVAVGGGLEEGLVDVLAAAKSDGVRVIELLGVVDPISRDGDLDPHFWLDPLRAKSAVLHLAEEFGSASDPRVDDYVGALEGLHADVEQILSDIPAQDRILVSSHDSLRYFADRYGFEIAGVIVPGGSTHGEPSSEHLSRLVDVINDRGIPAIFVDAGESADLADVLAAEADHPVSVVELYVGSVADAGTGPMSLEAMIRINAERIAEVLGG